MAEEKTNWVVPFSLVAPVVGGLLVICLILGVIANKQSHPSCSQVGHDWKWITDGEYSGALWKFECKRCGEYEPYHRYNMPEDLWQLVEKQSGLKRPAEAVQSTTGSLCPDGSHRWECTGYDSLFGLYDGEWTFKCPTCGLKYVRDKENLCAAEMDLIEAWCGCRPVLDGPATKVVPQGMFGGTVDPDAVLGHIVMPHVELSDDGTMSIGLTYYWQ